MAEIYAAGYVDSMPLTEIIGNHSMIADRSRGQMMAALYRVRLSSHHIHVLVAL